MTAGGAPVTISGTPVRLEPSGSIRFGTEEIPLATQQGSFRSGDDGSVAPPATFLGGQERVQALNRESVVGVGLLIAGFLWCN